MHAPLPRFALAAVCLAGALDAQVVEARFTHRGYNLDSGYLDHAGAAAKVVFSGTVRVRDAAWLKLYFDRTNLPGGSGLRLTALDDGAVQLFRADSLRDYGNRSAYFNGNEVRVELVAAPRTRGNRVKVVAVDAGDPADWYEPLSQCGPTDDRKPSRDPRQGRQFPTGCTSWLIAPCLVLTAGHCTGNPNQQIHFNVPPSTRSGRRVLPPPRDQFPYRAGSLRRLFRGVGRDWAVAATVRNSTTGLHAGEHQKTAGYELGTVPSGTSGETIRITGYGVFFLDRRRSQTQQTHVGPLRLIRPTYLRYATDTSGGNSGSPVIREKTGKAIGIHTHAGCRRTGTGGLGNHGTRIDRADLQQAIRSLRDSTKCGSYTTFGKGCPGARGTPALAGSGKPDVGGKVTITVRNLLANQPGVLYFGLSDERWAFGSLPDGLARFGMPGCTQYVSTEWNAELGSGNGTASLAVAIPSEASLVGAELFNQYLGVDRAANRLGVVASNAGKLLVGN